MRKTSLLLPIICIILFTRCIGEDIVFDTVEPLIRITNPLDSLGLSQSHQFSFSYLNNVGEEINANAVWSSSQPQVISITPEGLATALQIGESNITVAFDNGTKLVSETRKVSVGNQSVGTPTIKTGSIQTSSSYKLTGDFTLEEDETGLTLTFADNYEASTALPGLYIYLTNNPKTSVGALEIGRVTVFSGKHSYAIPKVTLQDYGYILYFCKPFNVKVGDGKIN
jgi:hypothetical protein